MFRQMLFTLVLIAGAAEAQVPSPAGPASPDATRIVQGYVDAFNRRDIDAMLAVAADSLEWINLSGATASLETSGKDALAKGLRSYFESCPSCRSSIAILGQSGPFLVATERATWESGGAVKAQESLSVYEIRDGKILRVWYFPAVRQP